MSLKILLASNSPWVSSGYGVSTSLLVEIFQQLGHEVAVSANFGLEGIKKTEYKSRYGKVDVYGRGNDAYCNDVIEAHAYYFGADVVISNMDTWVLNNWGSRTFAWLPIVPVPEDPLNPGIKASLHGQIDIVSMSKYSQQVLLDAGFPSTHIYLPVHTKVFHPFNRETMKKAMGWPSNGYIIGCVGMNRGQRKGFDLLLQAFRIVLAEIPNAYLYIHTDKKQHDGLRLEEIVSSLHLEKHVKFPASYDAFFGETQMWMAGMFNSFDVYVQPSLSEGQGVPVWEALSCGQVIVATDGSALSETMEEADAIPIKPVNRTWMMPAGGWGYEPSIDGIAEAIIQAYGKFGKNYISARNRTKAIENVSLEVTARQWRDVLIAAEKYIRFVPRTNPFRSKEKPKVVQISTRVPNCGIGAYTRHLMAACSEATEQECMDIFELQENFNPEAIPPCDLVHVHFESSLFPYPELLRKTLWQAKYNGAKIICTYHTVHAGVINEHLKDKLVDLAMIHWPPPNVKINNENVMILGGMGCPTFSPLDMVTRKETRERFGFTVNDTIISTFGFASVGRGHYEVLEELAPQLQQNPNVKMQLILSGNFLNEEGKNIVHQKIHEIAKAYHIGRQIFLVPEFITDLEVLQRLWVADVGFLYLDSHVASSSAAIRFFVSARLPIVTNESSHFIDIRRGVVRVPGFSIPEFSQEVWQTVHNPELLTKLRAEHEDAYRVYCWPAWGERVLGAYRRVLNG